LKDASYDIQRSAIRGLGRIPAKESLDALDEVFSAVGNTGLKQEAIRSYGSNGDHIGEKRVLDKLTSIAKSDSENLEVRTEAIRRIASFRGDAVVDRLFDIYNSLGDRNVKAGILQQVSSRGTREDYVLQRLTAIAKKETDASLQSDAVRRISDRTISDNSEGAINALIDLYDTTTNDSVKEEVIKGLGRSKNRKAVNKLLSIAEKDTNPKMRQLAVRRLSSNGINSY
jgi:HEAT repeat protein